MTKFLLFEYLSFMTIYAYLLTQNRLDAAAIAVTVFVFLAIPAVLGYCMGRSEK